MKSGVDNLAMGIIGIALACAFLIGLPISLAPIPFGVIVICVLALAIYESYEDAIQPLRRSSGSGRSKSGN